MFTIVTELKNGILSKKNLLKGVTTHGVVASNIKAYDIVNGGGCASVTSVHFYKATRCHIPQSLF
jgi:hypothetical protein